MTNEQKEMLKELIKIYERDIAEILIKFIDEKQLLILLDILQTFTKTQLEKQRVIIDEQISKYAKAGEIIK